MYQRIRSGFATDRPTWHCDGCGMCYRRSDRSVASAVPYDAENFRSAALPAQRPEADPLEADACAHSISRVVADLLRNRALLREPCLHAERLQITPGRGKEALQPTV